MHPAICYPLLPSLIGRVDLIIDHFVAYVDLYLRRRAVGRDLRDEFVARIVDLLVGRVFAIVVNRDDPDSCGPRRLAAPKR